MQSKAPLLSEKPRSGHPLPVRSSSRSASPGGRRYWAEPQHYISYGTSGETAAGEAKKRSRSQPILVSRFVYARRLKQRTVREVSSKLVQEAKKSYFHGRFNSSHGAVFTLPSRAQQLATYLPSDYPSSPSGGGGNRTFERIGVTTRRSRRIPSNTDVTNELLNIVEGMSPDTSTLLNNDPNNPLLFQRCYSADDITGMRAVSAHYRPLPSGDGTTAHSEEDYQLGSSLTTGWKDRERRTISPGSPSPPAAAGSSGKKIISVLPHRGTSHQVVEVRFDALFRPNASFASSVGGRSSVKEYYHSNNNKQGNKVSRDASPFGSASQKHVSIQEDVAVGEEKDDIVVSGTPTTTTTEAQRPSPKYSVTHPPRASSLPPRPAEAEVGTEEEYQKKKDEEEEFMDGGMISIWGAFLNLIFLAAPAAISIGFTFCTSIIPLAFVGSLRGEQEMTGASVGYFLTSSLILYPMIGMTFAMDTLCSHEFGRDSNSVELGLILQRGVLINFIFLTPLCIGMYFFRSVLVQLYGDELAAVAMDFLHFAPLFIYLISVLVSFTKFLNNQLQAHIPMIALTVGVFVTPIIQYFLTPLGVRFTMLGMALTTAIQLVIMACISLVKPETRMRLGSLRLREALEWEEVKEYILLALPSALFVAAEASSFDVTVLLAAHYGEAQGSVWSAMMNVLFLFAAFSGGISTSACANIGRCIGAYDPSSAKRYVVISIFVAAAIGVLDSVIIVTLFDFLLSLFGVTAKTRSLASSIRYIIPALHIADSIQFTFQGIFSGLGQNHYGALILLASLWGIGLPLCFLLGSFLHWGLYGVAVGLTIGLCIEAPLMILVATWYLDYEDLCYLNFMKEEEDDEEEETEEEEEEEEESDVSYDEEYITAILRRSGIVIPHPRVEDASPLRRQLWKQLAPRNFRKKYEDEDIPAREEEEEEEED